MKPEDIIELIPRFKTGSRAGMARNERFYFMEHLLRKYKYVEEELAFFKREIDAYQQRRLERAERLRQIRAQRKAAAKGKNGPTS